MAKAGHRDGGRATLSEQTVYNYTEATTTWDSLMSTNSREVAARLDYWRQWVDNQDCVAEVIKYRDTTPTQSSGGQCGTGPGSLQYSTATLLTPL